MAFSSDFLSLCQSQIVLLTQAMGASSVVIYVAKHGVSGQAAELIPVLTYPDGSNLASHYLESPLELENTISQSPTVISDANGSEQDRRLPMDQAWAAGSLLPMEPTYRDELHAHSSALGKTLASTEQGKLALPLLHDGVILGFLTITRVDRGWSDYEHSQLQQIAQTLAIAYFMEQQNQWLEKNLHQKQRLQEQQSQTFHDLLHQFRNPLTALRTFSALLLKRFRVEENADQTNQGKILAGIIRESDRLQHLLEQFDQTLTVGDRYWQDASPALSAGMSDHQQPNDVVLSTPHATGGVTKLIAAAPPSSVQDEDVNHENLNNSVGSSPTETAQIQLPRTVFGGEAQAEPWEINRILTPLLESTEAIAQVKSIQLYRDLLHPSPTVLIQPQALAEILTNLLDNAVKYSPKEAWLYVRSGFPASHQPNLHYGILIADGGPGIPTMDLDHIFERHYRGIQAHSTIAGTGIGLAIVKDLVDSMSAKISVFSPVKTCPHMPHTTLQTIMGQHPPGSGTAFLLWLPAST